MQVKWNEYTLNSLVIVRLTGSPPSSLSSSVLSGLEGAHDEVGRSKNIHACTPTGEGVSVHGGQQAVRDNFEEFLRAEVRLIEGLADTIEELTTGASHLELTRVLTVANAIIGANHRLVFGLTDLVEAGNNWGDKVRSESVKMLTKKYHCAYLLS
jgi:hypothetical protein